MDEAQRLVLVGGYSSPYSRKMRAVLRYRRIPHRWLLKGSPEAADLPKPVPNLIPALVFPDTPDEAHVDSTPLIRRLERDHAGRSVIPPDPAVATLRKELLGLGGANELTCGIDDVLFHYSLPVDVRHNVKINREELARWAAKQLA